MRRILSVLLLWAVTIVTLLILVTRIYWTNVQYIIARTELYFNQTYYVGQVAKVPADKLNLPKLVVFDWGEADYSSRLLVYDESDDLGDHKSIHERLFDVWPPAAPGFKFPPHTMKAIYQIDAVRL